MTTTVMLELTSAHIFRELRGHAEENKDEFIAEVQEAGGITLYLESHPHYRYLGKSHKATATACYFSDDIRNELGKTRQIADEQKLIVYPVNEETGESEPWRDEPVSEPS